MLDGLKPYPTYVASGIAWLGSIPAHWKTTRARFLFDEVDKRSQTGAETHLSMSQKLGLVPSSMVEQRTLVSESYAGGKLCEPDDLVLNRLKAHLGVFATAKQAGVISPDYTVLRPRRGLHVRYFEELLRSPACRAELRIRAKGIVEGFWRLYTDDFYSIHLPVPPPDEQVAIVRFLEHADRGIRCYVRAKQKLIRLLEEQKHVIIHRAVTRGVVAHVPLKSSGLDWLGEIPQHWKVCQIRHFANVGNGSTPSRAEPEYWVNGVYPWLNSGTVNQGAIRCADQFVTQKALRECHLPRVPAGSVLVAITGQGKTRGMAATLHMEATINQHLAFITPREHVSVMADFLKLLLTAAYPALRRISDASGSTKGALTCGDLRHFKVVLPSLAEQSEIVRWAAQATSEIDSALRLATREIALLRELRTRLIADVVTGSLDVRAVALSLPDMPTDAGPPNSDDEGDDSDGGDGDDDSAAVLPGDHA